MGVELLVLIEIQGQQHLAGVTKGFSRKSVASWLKADENDYIASNIEACLEQAAYELFDVGFQDIQDMKQRIIKLVKEKQMRK